MISGSRDTISPRTRYVLLAVVLLVTLAGLWPLIAQVHVAEYDEAIFLDVARNIQTTGRPVRSLSANGIYFFDHTPLYTYLISLITGSADQRVMVARWLTVICALGCVVLTFLCGELLKNTLAGFIAALLTAVNSFFLIHSFFVRMEVLMVLLLLASLYGLIRGEMTGAYRWYFVGGLALAGAVLTKEVAMGMAVTYGVYGGFLARKHDRLRRFALLIGPAIFALLMWGWWAWSWSPTATQAVLQRWFSSAAIGGTDFRMKTTAWQWAEMLGRDLVSWGVGALFLVSLYFYARDWRNQRRVILVPGLYVGLALTASFLMQLKELRYLSAVVPMLALVMGIGVSQLLTGLRVRQARGAQLLVGALVCVALLDASPLHLIPPNQAAAGWLDPLYADRLQENDRYYEALRSAGVYLAEHAPANEVVAVVHEASVVSFYADRPYIMLYTFPFEKVIEKLSQARYLVYDQRVFPQLSEDQIQEAEAYIRRHFAVETEFTENGRGVTLYRNVNVP